jgi:prolyl oligopeptidase
LAKGRWVKNKIQFPPNGTAEIYAADAFDNRALANFEGFTTPSSLYMAEGSGTIEKLKALPAQYDARDVSVEQYWATSRDGTKVPYFVVEKKVCDPKCHLRREGDSPTLLYGYGGFEISMTPFYLRSTGKVWTDKGGVYVLANIRGGGEFGPAWHQAALKKNRMKAYEDFEAVTEDLFRRKITSPRRLGIEGGSNGGLLVGVAFTRHPQNYNAVICVSALLDMLRYHKLPPGASWIGEYGNPDDPEMAKVIRTYSPYQNIKADVKYPKVLFYTSTADDRVQPGHTRKVVAKLEELGNPVLMYENTEGGHGAAADLEQKTKELALEFTYLYQQLMPGGDTASNM